MGRDSRLNSLAQKASPQRQCYRRAKPHDKGRRKEDSKLGFWKITLPPTKSNREIKVTNSEEQKGTKYLKICRVHELNMR